MANCLTVSIARRALDWLTQKLVENSLFDIPVNMLTINSPTVVRGDRLGHVFICWIKWLLKSSNLALFRSVRKGSRAS